MNKHNIAFIDHPFHQKTGSSNFFIELLSELFNVHIFYLSHDPRELIKEIGDSAYDLIVCWQTEFCAPYFLMRGKRVVCVPMYDGVAELPEWYWHPMRQARFINFCQALHLRHKSMGIESLYAKYYGTKEIDIQQAVFNTLHGFFWQRRPEEGLDYRFARHLLGTDINTLHIHNAPDTCPPEDWEPDMGCSVSYFSDDGADYLKALEHANIFVCPRRTEGIGHTLIEAMARGMFIIAHDKPVANEYIIHGVNGILLDYDAGISVRNFLKTQNRIAHFNTTYAETLGKNAREFYLRGYAEWQKTAKLVPFFVQTTPAPDLSRRDLCFAEAYLEITKFSQHNFFRYLHELLKLKRKGWCGDEASAISGRESIKLAIKSFPGIIFIWRIIRRLRMI